MDNDQDDVSPCYGNERNSDRSNDSERNSYFDESAFTFTNQGSFRMQTIQTHGKGHFFENENINANAVILEMD